MLEKPVFLQGTCSFRGHGFDAPTLVAGIQYTVPEASTAKLVYFRAGQSSEELITLNLERDGQTKRLYPLGMTSSMHYTLAITEEMRPGSKLELKLAAPKGVEGTLFVDLGVVETQK